MKKKVKNQKPKIKSCYLGFQNLNLIYLKALFFTFHFLLFIFHLSAQTVSASLDRNKILLGEQVTLQLKAEDINAETTLISNWFNFPDTINHLQVAKRENIDTVAANDAVSYLQKITLTSFDSGKWKLPQLQISVQDKNSGKQTILKTDTLSLEVLPVDVSNLQDYHDIKDIIDVQVKNNLWIIISIAAVIILLLVLIIRWIIKRKKKKILVQKPVIKGSLLEWAMEQINALQKENLPAKNQTKLFYIKLDAICRQYFDEQLHIGAMYSTSDEMMIKLKLYMQQENSRTSFYQLLRLSDAVKFAKYVPADAQNTEAVSIAKEAIHQTDISIHHMKKNNAY